MPQLEFSALGMEYKGFHPKNSSQEFPVINISDYTEEKFYNEFVKTRTPVLINDDFKGSLSVLKHFAKWRDLRYLKKVAGREIVQVEKRASTDDGFGKDHPRERMLFSELIEALLLPDLSSDNFYMTTQYEENDLYPTKQLFQPPIFGELASTIPKRPALLPSLVPQQMNLWLGRCLDATKKESGVSSGLHHDFADNLYVLLRGVKRFTLFSPKDAFYMSTFGEIERVHPNGLISYQGVGSSGEEDDDDMVREDGAVIGHVKAALGAGAKKILKRKRKANVLLNFSSDSDADGFFEDGVDDFSDCVSLTESVCSSDCNGEREKACPVSFSRIPSRALHGQPNFERYPALKKATKLQVTVAENQMLYLPAGWFHEVTSFPQPKDGNCSPEEAVHMAFNYWFHPPSYSGSFRAPYPDSYWENYYAKHFAGDCK